MIRNNRQANADMPIGQTIMDSPCLVVGKHMWADASNPFNKANDYMLAYHRKRKHSVLDGKFAFGCRINEILLDGSVRVDWSDGTLSHRLVGNQSVWRAPAGHPVFPLVMPRANDEDDEPITKKKVPKKVSKKHNAKQDTPVEKPKQRVPNPKKRKVAVHDPVPTPKKRKAAVDDEVGEAVQLPHGKSGLAPREIDMVPRDAEWCEAYVQNGDVMMDGVEKVGSWLKSSKEMVDYDELVEKYKAIELELTTAKDELETLQESSAAATLVAQQVLDKVKLDASGASAAYKARLDGSEEHIAELMVKLGKLQLKVRRLTALKQLSRDELQETSRVRNSAVPRLSFDHRAAREFAGQASVAGSRGPKG